VKVAAVAAALADAALPLPPASWACVGYAAASGVADQPMSDDETLRGARARALAAAAAHTAATGQAPVFAVGLEGGCAVLAPLPPGAAAAAPDADAPPPPVECFAWMAVLHCASGQWGTARTGAFVLPPAVARLVLDGVELGVADDRVFGRVNSKASDGAVGLLSGGVIDRTAYYRHALLLALIPFVSAQHYFGPAFRLL